MQTSKESYEPLFRTSPYLELIGPIYQLRVGNKLHIGLQIEAKHCNARGSVHGGVLSTLADIALGYNTAFSEDEPVPLATAQLNIDFMGKAEVGDWLEVQTEVQKIGRNLAFASCVFHVGDKRIAKASGLFSVLRK